MATSQNGFIKQVTAFTPPFVEQGEGWAPPLGNDIEVCPFLPEKRKAQMYQGNFPNFDLPIVIEAGEPVGVWYDTTAGKPWLVPCSPVAYTLTYGTNDVGKAEDIDSAGNAVTASGASSATIPATLPIGVANAPIPRNASLSTGLEVNENFKFYLKATVMRRRAMQYPYFRFGPNGIGEVRHGDLMGPHAINGNTLSSDNRAGLAPIRIETGTSSAATSSTVVVTPAVGGWADDDSFQVTVAGVTVTYHFKTSTAGFTSTGTYRYLATTGANTTDNDAIVADFPNTALAARATITDGGTTVTWTSIDEGAVAVDYTEVTDTSTYSGATTVGDAGSGVIHAGYDINADNIAMACARVIRVWTSMPDNWDLSKAATPKNSSLAGTGTGGVAQELYFSGNTFEGNVVPSSFDQAGAFLVVYEL